MSTHSFLRSILIASMVGAAFALSTVIPTSALAGEDWRSQQERWWNDAQLVKGAIVGYLKLLNNNPQLETKENPHWEVLSLVLVLDSRSDAETLKTLAELARYNLGASGSEVYQCVVQRKGKKILPTLRAELASPRNECGDAMGGNTRACLSPTEFAARIRGLVAAIQSNQSCSIEK